MSDNTMTVSVGATQVSLLDDDRICQHLAAGRDFEPVTREAWYRALRTVPVLGWVIDVGAYSGLFSIAAAKMGHHAVAVEPLIELQERIRQNALLNHVSNYVTIIPAAATHFTGEIGIGVNDKVHLTSGASVLRKSNQRVVPAWRLDDFEPGELPVVAIKIDVERHECAVLEGGRQLIMKHRPTLIVEALNDEARAAVTLALLPNYRLDQRMDDRNMLMVPR